MTDGRDTEALRRYLRGLEQQSWQHHRRAHIMFLFLILGVLTAFWTCVFIFAIQAVAR